MAALDDIQVALDVGINGNEDTGQVEILAACHDECRYAWAIPVGLQLRAEAWLLQAAQNLGADSFVPAKQHDVPTATRKLITDAEVLLREALELWQPLHDPNPELADQNFELNDKKLNYKAAHAYQVFSDLEGGLLTSYPLRLAAMNTRIDAPNSVTEDSTQLRTDQAESMDIPTSPKVLISYTHDSAVHSKRVLELSNRLRGDGVESIIDQYIQNPSEGWPMWMHRQIEKSDFVLVVSTERYSQKAQEPKNSGGRFESVLILQDLYDAGMSNDKFIPIIFDSNDSTHILKWVRQLNRYNVAIAGGYQSELARRRYEEVDPGNRLVAAELERRWEAQLLEQRQSEESLHRFEQEQPSKLTAAEAKQIQELSQDIPSLWNAPTTSGVDRQTVFRILVDRIEVEIIGSSERVGIVIHWVGGYDSHHEIRRSVQKFEQLESADTIRDAIIKMKRGGISHPVVAKNLNAAGYHSTHGSEFTAAIVSNLCRQFREQGVDLSVSADDWSLTDLAAELGVKRETLNTWRVHGWLHADRIGQRWVFRVDADELARLKKLTEYNRSPLIKTPKELTTPKQKRALTALEQHQIRRCIMPNPS